MPVLVVLFLLLGLCIGSWRTSRRRTRPACRLEAEKDALRRAIAAEESVS
jgi:hypothetical protein